MMLKQLTRFEQTLFGLPFIFAAALLSFVTHTNQIDFQINWLWIVPAFMAARMSGMAFNQVIDRYIDAENQRTKMRVVASGALSSKKAYFIATTSLLLFLFFCSQINLPTLYLALFAAPLLFIYSYMKRITALCHFILGIIHFLGTLMAWVAINGCITFTPVILALINMTLIVGMDIIYALQDLTFDRMKGLHSLPVKFGVKGAKGIAQCLHLSSIVLLVFLGQLCHFTLLYYLAPFIVFCTFTFFYFKVERGGVREFEPLFFYCTIITSFSTLAFILLEWR